MKAKYGNIGYYDLRHNNKMPILEINIVDDEDNIVETVYLSPFRFYRFQISKTFDGQIDCGASLVRNFDSYFNISRDILEEMIRGQIAICFNDFTSNVYGAGTEMPPLIGFNSNKINEFISETIDMYFRDKNN